METMQTAYLLVPVTFDSDKTDAESLARLADLILRDEPVSRLEREVCEFGEITVSPF